MIILGRDGYIRPRRHPGKAESLYVIKGRAHLVLFDEDVTVKEVVTLIPPEENGFWTIESGTKLFFYPFDRNRFFFS